MWQSLAIKLSMLAVTIGVVYWIGWTVPSTVTRPAHSVVESASEPDSRPPSTVVSPPGSVSSEPILAGSSHLQHQGDGGKLERAKLDLNRADVLELEELPGIGPVLAERIVDYRRSGRTFRTVEDLREVKGIGQKKFERIRALVTVTPTSSQATRGKKAA